MDTLKIDLEIVTPERLVLSETVDDVVLPGTEGYLGVLPGHAPLLTALAPGEIAYTSAGKKRYLSVSGGYAEVLQHRVSVLAETCERGEDIDGPRAQLARQRAAAEIARPDADAPAREEARLALLRAEARILVAKHTRP